MPTPYPYGGPDPANIVSSSGGGGLSGHGAPASVVAAGTTYLDLDSGKFYVSNGATWSLLKLVVQSPGGATYQVVADDAGSVGGQAI